MLELKNVGKIYETNGKQLEAIKDLNFSVQLEEFAAIVGPSGCGKTTLIKLIAGLIPASHGSVVLDGNIVKNPGKDRGVVFQNFTLFPWLTVAENITFGLDIQRMNAKKKAAVATHYLGKTGSAEFVDFYPNNLSGGMQQRVAIARTLANEPKILLMDEPFGSLDAQTRMQMQEFLTKLWEAERKTIIFVTHDVGEAVFLADTVHVLSKRPTTIKKTFKVPFPRPRTHTLKQTKAFFEFEAKIAEALEA